MDPNINDGTARPIRQIDFNILGNDEIRKISVVKSAMGIDIPDLYENLEAKKGGLIDPRLGTTNNSNYCATCQFNTTYCNGHFGHIDLAEDVFHIGYINYVKRILDVICLRCSRLLVHKDDDAVQHLLKTKSGKARLSELKQLSKNVKYCRKKKQGCGAPVSKIKIEIKKGTASINIISEMDSDMKDDNTVEGNSQIYRVILNPEIIHSIFSHISPEHCEMMGIDPEKSHPKDMIHKVFPVPPVQVRPSVRGDFMGGSTMEDDLTHKLADIVKSNNAIQKQKDSANGHNNKYNKDRVHLLQYHIATFFDNEAVTLGKGDPKGKPFKALAPRLKSKEGRFRGNLMGKRGDFSARTVITSDPTIEINEVGVPMLVAKILTFPETVTIHNRDRLSLLVKRGRDEYPGANVVFQASHSSHGQRMYPIDLRFRKEEIELKLGDIVERHITDGDMVLLNRQPTLHKQSMMGHKIKVIPDERFLTYRLSVGVTTPYNADFDGDEMNIFLPQSIQTQIELKEIAAVERQIICPASARTSIGIVQDGLLGAYNMTHPDMKISWRPAMNIIAHTSLDDFSFFKKKEGSVSGSDLYSLIIPDNIYSTTGGMDIRDGKIISGRLTKDALGAQKKNNLIQSVWDEHGIIPTKDFINNTQWIINNFNLYNGFTVGVGDIHIADDVNKEAKSYIATVEAKINNLITNKENKPNFMDEHAFEMSIYYELNVIRDNVSKIISENLPEMNNFKIMMTSGSKGGPENVGQMIGCVGLQVSEGKLIQKKYNRRTLPYFGQDDDRAKSRGLIINSYQDGMTYPEFTYHSLTGREGLIDGSIKTAETGYAQRRLIKSSEDIKITYDGTVRLANNNIVQFVYGDSGSDPTKQFEYKFKMITLNNTELREKFTFSESELKSLKNFKEYDNKKLFHEMRDMRNKIIRCVFRARLEYKGVYNSFMIPVNLARVIENIVKSGNSDNTIDDPKYIINQIELLISSEVTTLVYMSQKERQNADSIKFRDDRTAKTLLKAAMYDALSPKRVISEYKFSKEQFDRVIEKISDEFNKNMVEPGEMVGIIGAQSLGQPLTQMSMIGSSQVIIYDCAKNETSRLKIGDFIDGLMNNKNVVELNIPSNCELKSQILDTDNYCILGVSDNECVSWNRISQVSRHPANGKLIKIKTKSGRTTTTTLSHSHLKRHVNGIVPVAGSELKIGDRIPVVVNIPTVDTQSNTKLTELTENTGRAYGRKLACDAHDIDGSVFGSNKEFIGGVIVGYCETKCDHSPMMSSMDIQFNSTSLLDDMAILLAYHRVFGSIVEDGKKSVYRVEGIYADRLAKLINVCIAENNNCNDVIPEVADIVTYVASVLQMDDIKPDRLIVKDELATYIDRFNNAMNNTDSYNIKQHLIYYINMLKNAYSGDVVWDNIIDIELIEDPMEYVYDFTVPSNQTFMVDTGILVHNTLNTFHNAGIGNLTNTTSGVPRIKEILSVSKNPKTPHMLIYMEKECRGSREIANKIASHIKYTTIGHIKNKIEIYYDNEPNAEDGLMKSDNIGKPFYTRKASRNSCQVDIDNLPWLLRIELSREKMIEKEVTLLEIKSKFCNWWERRHLDSKSMKKEERKVLQKITSIAVLSNTDSDKIPVIHLRFNVKDVDKVKDPFNTETLNSFIDNIVDTFKLKGLNGIPDIDSILSDRIVTFGGNDYTSEVSYDEKNNEEQKIGEEFVIYTSGVNLYDIRYIDGIDLNRTISDDIIEVYDTFGIEVVRSVLIREIILAYERAGKSINYQHVTVLVDLMTMNGYIMSIDRHGVHKSESDPLCKASFEKTVEQLLTASVFSESDYMRGMSARIMAGMVIRGGTGYPLVKVNTKAILESEYVEDVHESKQKTIDSGGIATDIIDKNKGSKEIFIPGL
jgi:DNA-directed RNA polymerase II subunit RPB1